MTKKELKEQREKLFNEDFSVKERNLEEITIFCRELMQTTGIQACNSFGYINELLPKLYYSTLSELE